MPGYEPASVRFWRKVRKIDGGCWLWMGARRTGSWGCGYGVFRDENYFRGSTPRVVAAHRWAYERLRGPIPDGLVLDHLCNVRNCVNPDHLEPVTVMENARRGNRHDQAVTIGGDEYPQLDLFES